MLSPFFGYCPCRDIKATQTLCQRFDEGVESYQWLSSTCRLTCFHPFSTTLSTLSRNEIYFRYWRIGCNHCKNVKGKIVDHHCFLLIISICCTTAFFRYDIVFLWANCIWTCICWYEISTLKRALSDLLCFAVTLSSMMIYFFLFILN